MKLSTTLGLCCLALLMAKASNSHAATDPRYTNTIAQMTAYITSQMAAQNVQGMSIALVDSNRVVWATGFGNADREDKIVADADTVYHIGSCSKAFLGTAYMQLLDQSRVDLEAPLTNYIPEFAMLPRFTNSASLTIRSLLNHHSGLPGDFFNGMVTTRLIDDYPAWLINFLNNDYPFAPVNERASYCNSGFVLLSDAIRRITGEPFPAALDAMILTPLGMDASSFLPDKPAISNRLAATYSYTGERLPPEILNALGSGSMYSSANDLTKYIQMIMADGQYNGQNLVSSNGIDIMTTAQLTNLPLNVTDNPQGLGWDDVNDYRLRYAGKVFWKDGATYFHCAYIGMSRDLKLGVAVLQNSPGSLCDAVGIEALRWAILDKTSNHWPTNTFVPPPSPVTNQSQSQIDAVAGLYVGSAGYHKVVAVPGALTLTINAHSDTPAIASNLVPRANGWFSKTNSQDNQFAFTNLAGHDMLVLHQVSGAFEVAEPVGEHYLPGPLSAVWSARTNRVYRIVDMYPSDYFWEPSQPMTKTLHFSVKDEALISTWMLGVYVIEPQNDNLAFQRGTHYRKGGAIQVTTTNGLELLQYSSYRFLDEAAIPTLPVSTITNGSIPFANGTQWYWFTGQTGKKYRARLTAPNQNYFVRITDREGITFNSGANEPATWTCTSNGIYAIAVSATNSFAFSLSLTVCGSRQTQNDYDGDGRADPAIYDNGSGLFTVFQSANNYFPDSVQLLQPTAYNLQPVFGDFDGDAKADPAVYDPTTSQLLARCSSQSYRLSTMPIGNADCMPVCGDFDGDHKADPALYSATAGLLAAWLSGSGYTVVTSMPLGGAGWLNACEDYDGDGKTDPAVYDMDRGTWQVALSGNAYAFSSLVTAGGSGFVPVPGDYDGDGKADPTIFQPATGLWLFALSSHGYAQTLNNGLANPMMLPRPGDYDNDGKTDLAIYDPVAKIFYAWLSGSNYHPSCLSW